MSDESLSAAEGSIAQTDFAPRTLKHGLRPALLRGSGLLVLFFAWGFLAEDLPTGLLMASFGLVFAVLFLAPLALIERLLPQRYSAGGVLCVVFAWATLSTVFLALQLPYLLVVVRTGSIEVGWQAVGDALASYAVDSTTPWVVAGVACTLTAASWTQVRPSLAGMCGLYAGGLIMVNVVSFALGNSAAQAGRHSGYAMAWGCLLLLVSGYYAMLETLETRLWGAPPELEPAQGNAKSGYLVAVVFMLGTCAALFLASAVARDRLRAALPQSLRRLRSDDAQTRLEAAADLASWPESEEATRALFERSYIDPALPVRRQALRSLKSHGGATDALVDEAAASKDYRARGQAMTLVAIRGKRAKEFRSLIMFLLEDEHPRVRLSAALALVEIDPRRAEPAREILEAELGGVFAPQAKQALDQLEAAQR